MALIVVHRLSNAADVAGITRSESPTICVKVRNSAMDNDASVRDSIRSRPGMYVGSTGPNGVRVLALEILGNAVDQVLAARADSIEVVTRTDGSIEIRDNGPGINLDDDRVRRYFTSHHDEPTADGHIPHVHISYGHAGLGLFVVTSLCEMLTVHTVHAGRRIVHEWTDAGLGHRTLENNGVPEGTATFTAVRFWPDRTIFGSARLPADQVLQRLEELQRLVPNLRAVSFHHSSAPEDDGLVALMTDNLRLVSDPIWRHEERLTDDTGEPIVVDLALSLGPHGSELHRQFPEQMLLYCNFFAVNDESGLHRAIRSALGASEEEPLNGLAVACNLRMLAPTFSGPTKQRVDDPVAMAAVASATTALLENNGDLRSAIAEMLAQE